MWCLQLALYAIRSAILSTHFIDLHYNQLPSVQMQCYHSKSERKQGGEIIVFNNFYHEYKEKIKSKTLNANCNNRTQYYRQVWKLKKTIKTIKRQISPPVSHNRVKTAYVVAGVTNTLEMQRGARHVEPANVTRHGPLHENMAPSTNPEVNSDSVTVFKSRLSLVKPITRLKTFLFSVAFSLPFISNTAPVPGTASLELRPYGAIQNVYYCFNFFNPR